MLDFKRIIRRYRGVLSGIGMIVAVVLIFWTVNNLVPFYFPMSVYSSVIMLTKPKSTALYRLSHKV